MSFARFAPGAARPELAAAGAAGRHQRQRRPRVRPGPAAPPRRGTAAPGAGGQAARGDQAGRAARRGPGRALAPDRRGDRRVPGAARPARDAVADEAVDAARGPGPARPLAGHPPGAGLPGRVRHRGAVGPLRPGRPVHAADRAAQGAPDPGRHQPGRRRSSRASTRWSTPTPGVRRRQPDRAAAGRRRPDAWRALQEQAVARPAGRAASRRGSSTATRCPAVPPLPAAGRVPELPRRSDRRRARCSARRSTSRRRPARLRLGRMPGRNLAVLGTRTDEACDVLARGRRCRSAGAGPGAVQRRLPRRRTPRTRPPRAGAPSCRSARLVRRAADLAELFERWTPDGIPHYVLGYALDAADRPQRTEPARRCSPTGPERRVPTCSAGGARWPGCATTWAGSAPGCDAIGAWVALDVHGAELAPLSPQPGGPAWYPRPRRALFFDRVGAPRPRSDHPVRGEQ